MESPAGTLSSSTEVPPTRTATTATITSTVSSTSFTQTSTTSTSLTLSSTNPCVAIEVPDEGRKKVSLPREKGKNNTFSMGWLIDYPWTFFLDYGYHYVDRLGCLTFRSTHLVAFLYQCMLPMFIRISQFWTSQIWPRFQFGYIHIPSYTWKYTIPQFNLSVLHFHQECFQTRAVAACWTPGVRCGKSSHHHHIIPVGNPVENYQTSPSFDHGSSMASQNSSPRRKKQIWGFMFSINIILLTFINHLIIEISHKFSPVTQRAFNPQTMGDFLPAEVGISSPVTSWGFHLRIATLVVNTHMQPMVLVYLPTKLGDFWGKCWCKYSIIFQHHGLHMGYEWWCVYCCTWNDDRSKVKKPTQYWDCNMRITRTSPNFIKWSFCLISHRIHGAGIYANIWGILMVNVTIYIAYMDPMGMISCDFRYLPIMSEKNPGKSSICELNLH